MIERIQQIIEVKARGKQAEFARQMGWRPQYIQRLLHGTIGITPIQKICSVYPDINARWLLLGEGEMIPTDKETKLSRLLDMEKYICVMTAEEKVRLINGELDFDCNKLEVKRQNYYKEINEVFAEAYKNL